MFPHYTQEPEKPHFSTKFAVLETLEAYTALNNAIGTAKSYPDEKSDTMNYSDPEPKPNWDDKFYMIVTAEVQERWPGVLEGITLVDKIPVKPEPKTKI